MTESTKSDVSATVLWAAIVASMVGILFYNVMPLYLGTMQDSTGFTGGQIGAVASIFFVGFNLSSASTFFWIHQAPIRNVTLGSMIALAVLFPASSITSSYAAIMMITLLIGGASGALGSIAAAIVSGAHDENKWFGYKVGGESAASVILFFVLPATLIPAFGFGGTVMGMTAVILVLIPIVFLLSKEGFQLHETHDATRQATSDKSQFGVWMALLGSLVMFLGGSAIWAFEERIASLNGYDPVWVGFILGVSLIFAVIGSLLAGPIGAKLKKHHAFAAGAAFMVLGVFAIGAAPSANVFAAGAFAFMLGWGGAVPFLYAVITETDPNGKFITLAIPAIGIGSMVGPTIAGMLYSSGSLTVLQNISIFMILTSVGLVWVAGAPKSHRQQ